MLHSMNRRVSAAFRFVFYLPAALAGSASVMLWLFMLQPGKSPWSFVLNWLGYHSLGDSLTSPQPAGGLRADRVLERCRELDRRHVRRTRDDSRGRARVREARRRGRVANSGPRQAAVDQEVDRIHGDRRVRRRVAAVRRAGAHQRDDGLAVTNQNWSPNQLAVDLAFRLDNFNYAAAISIDLLVAALICAAVILLRTGLFEVGH